MHAPAQVHDCSVMLQQLNAKHTIDAPRLAIGKQIRVLTSEFFCMVSVPVHSDQCFGCSCFDGCPLSRAGGGEAEGGVRRGLGLSFQQFRSQTRGYTDYCQVSLLGHPTFVKGILPCSTPTSVQITACTPQH